MKNIGNNYTKYIKTNNIQGTVLFCFLLSQGKRENNRLPLHKYFLTTTLCIKNMTIIQ